MELQIPPAAVGPGAADPLLRRGRRFYRITAAGDEERLRPADRLAPQLER